MWQEEDENGEKINPILIIPKKSTPVEISVDYHSVGDVVARPIRFDKVHSGKDEQASVLLQT